MSIQMNPCPCGLTREEVLAGRLVGSGGVCTAFRRGSRTELCDELLADHPSSAQVQPGERKSIWIFLYHFN